METQNRWGTVVLAGIFAVTAIGIAGVTYFLENKAPAEKPAVALGGAGAEAGLDSDGDGLFNWQEELWGTDPQNPDSDYDGTGDAEEARFVSGAISPGETSAENGAADTDYAGLSTTETLSLGIAKEYGNLNDPSLSAEERERIIENIIANALPKTSEAPKASMAELSVSASTQLEVYAELLILLLKQSSAVREYELSVFARAVRDQNYSGSPELVESATIYKKIRASLITMSVPPSVANEHLAVVNELGALAHIVGLMAEWNGDPTVGLLFVNEFSKAEQGTAVSVNAIIARIAAVAKTQS